MTEGPFNEIEVIRKDEYDKGDESPLGKEVKIPRVILLLRVKSLGDSFSYKEGKGMDEV